MSWVGRGRAGTVAILAGVGIIVAAGGGPGTARAAGRRGPVWYGAEGEVLPFEDPADIEDFLRSAAVVSVKELSVGITGPKKLLLERDGVRAHAVFKDVDEVSRGKTDLDGYIIIDLKDSHLFDCAAYRLDRLLGLGRVPPAVPRDLDGRSGTVTLWVEGVMTEKDRRDRGLEAPDPARWEQQKQIMYVFDNLIGNTDRNLGNILIDRSWRLWLIDHTRAFVTSRALPDPARITRCERGLYTALEVLDEAQVRDALSPDLDKREIRALLARRDAILRRLDKEIADRGAETVLYDLTPAGSERDH